MQAHAAQRCRRIDVNEVTCAARSICHPQRTSEPRLSLRQRCPGGCHVDQDRVTWEATEPRTHGFRTHEQAQTWRLGIWHVGQEDQRLALYRPEGG